ncbi:TPA: assimilatory sulfite reductase (NADPH) flavoprotein subunit [Xanthomonas vasicola pv. zeae]|uniref:Sulfite reductase [NADPH] flavoprotein alpha-component n=1 Tax=Xanthomonas vasicola pv. vasculorum TaxID=325776 RepID=A0AAE8JVH1_XANVA|nr:assimilatory sulfite reductase (NADPH) flavoprotein subunit [Xanthomonas vasicola]AVQ08069.1 assimilatory sulfite reductase (NADPH) flavoprotein subunit [Xanthomonas vasicola pv. vasculorum]AZM72268.1 assimilatory sulfite reductase (NADPH) flavoprotein subunit [Xanthomonas vasicola pv. vasculorum]KFA33965.1 NADP oxidoreductase [Xanthomonas vasicola pv. vasculorum NCPPB 206]MDO6951263.1 assimilatory sulfite reductase (NADPH) flavoprotein subunit [Xanthomonas vasicola]MDO6954621.1 assimilator
MTAASSALPPSPLPDERKALLDRLVDGLDSAALWWLSGYAAGLAQGHPPRSLAVLPGGQAHAIAKEGQRLTVLYGSQTGNARREAEQLAADAEAAGLSVRLLRADAYSTRELASERLLYVVISTQGEGDPPDDAIGLVEFLASRRAPRLPELKYAVLGLGDSSYADFCGIARRIDERLAELGGSRVQPRGEADLDIDSVAAPWRTQALKHAREQLKSGLHSATVTPLRSSPIAPAWSHQQPFAAELLSTQIISGRDFKGPGFRVYATPGKRVRHLEFSLEGSGLSYEPGDALGIRHRNPPALVDAVLQTLQLDGDAAVTVGEETLALNAWLATQRELTKLSRPFLTAHAERAGTQELQALLAPTQTAGLAALLADHQVIDVLRRWPADWDHAGLLAALRPLTPRLYSIASSRKRVGDEVHLTVDEVTYQAHGHAHLGSASGFLAALAEGDTAPVYIEPNERFRVPADSDRDILMIGPGTGVAPFRGFVQERAETGAKGRNWLFFGAQHFNTDFLYQAEWQLALQRGELHALEVAFSRDQAEKLYVQHRLRARGAEVHAWLQGGAHVYVCGSTSMGKDVHAALLDIVATHGALDAEAAAAYLTQLQVEGRYARDVY